MEEIFKVIEGHEGFEISSLGKVRDIKTGKNKRVSVNKENEDRTVKLDGEDLIVHELVAKAFLDGNGEIIHIDGNKANNKVENLMYKVEEEEVIEEKVELEEDVIEIEEEMIDEPIEEIVNKVDKEIEEEKIIEKNEVFIAKMDIKVEENYIKTMKDEPKKKQRKVCPLIAMLGKKKK